MTRFNPYVVNPWAPESQQRPLPHDPISASLGALASFFTASAPLNLLAFTSVGAGAFGAIGTSLLIGAALSFAANAIMGPGQRSLTAGVNSNEVRLNTRQEVPHVRVAVGEVLVGGALFFEECKPPYLYLGTLLSEGPITSLVGLQNSQTRIGINYDTFEVLTPPYTGNLKVSFRNGDPDQTVDPILAADFPNLGPNFRQREIATLVIKANYGNGDATQRWEEFQAMWGQGGKPNILAKVRGIAVYDPRDPSQTKPPAREDYPDDASYDAAYRAAQSTWKWSNNATLIQTWYLMWRAGGRVSPKKIRWDKTAESANWDDGLIGTKAYTSVSTANPNGTSTDTDGNTWLDRDRRLPNGQLLHSIGTSSSTPYSGSVKIVRRVSAGNYDVVLTRSITHAGNGWQDFPVQGFRIPATGDYFAAVWTPSGITNNVISSGVNRAFASGEASGDGVSFSESSGQCLPVRAKLATTGGLIPRHTIDGVITSGQEPYTVLQSMLTANRGMVIRSAGDMWIQTGPQEPILTITDDLLAGDVQFTRSQPKKDLLNRVRCRFIDPRQDWQTVDGPVIDRPDYRQDDKELLEGSCEFAFTADHRRAQRLAKCFMADSRLGRKLVLVTTLQALARAKGGELDPGRVVRVQLGMMPRANGIYRIMEVGLTEGFGSLAITLAEYDASIEKDWHPETDEQDFELPDLDLS